MANAKFIEQKAAKVAEIQAKIEKAKSIVFFDYRGITVAEDTELRRSMRKENVEYIVLKNNMVSRAAENASIDSKIATITKKHKKTAKKLLMKLIMRYLDKMPFISFSSL